MNTRKSEESFDAIKKASKAVTCCLHISTWKFCKKINDYDKKVPMEKNDWLKMSHLINNFIDLSYLC